MAPYCIVETDYRKMPYLTLGSQWSQLPRAFEPVNFDVGDVQDFTVQGVREMISACLSTGVENSLVHDRVHSMNMRITQDTDGYDGYDFSTHDLGSNKQMTVITNRESDSIIVPVDGVVEESIYIAEALNKSKGTFISREVAKAALQLTLGARLLDRIFLNVSPGSNTALVGMNDILHRAVLSEGFRDVQVDPDYAKEIIKKEYISLSCAVDGLKRVIWGGYAEKIVKSLDIGSLDKFAVAYSTNVLKAEESGDKIYHISFSGPLTPNLSHAEAVEISNEICYSPEDEFVPPALRLV